MSSPVANWLIDIALVLDGEIYNNCIKEIWLPLDAKMTPARRSMQQFYNTTYKIPVVSLDLVPVYALGTFQWTELECSMLPETVLGLSVELAATIAGQLNRGMSDSIKGGLKRYAED